MLNTQGYSWKKTVNQILLPSVVLASGAMFLMTGCQSPVQPDSFETTWSGYANSILARSIADNSINTIATENNGIHEMKTNATNPSGPDAGAISPAGVDGAAKPDVLNGEGAESARFGIKENRLTLSLQEAIVRALKHSLAIKVEAYNPGIKEAQIQEAMGSFDPVLFGQSQWTNQDQPSALASTTVNGVNWQNSVGVKQLLSSGGTVQVGTGDIYRNVRNVFPNSSHEANVNLSLSQPLLKGFGSAVTKANIYLAQRDHRIALATFKRKVISNLVDVETAYHNLVQAQTIVDINVRLLANTQNTFEKIKARRDVDADAVQIKQAEAAVQMQQAQLIRAQSTVRKTSDQLKALINDPELDLRSNLLIVPSDRPVDVPVAYNLAEQLDIALRQRTEMQEARLQIERADIIINAARNDLLPQLDVTASAQSNGFDNGLDTAYNTTIDSAKYIDYAAGLKFSMPIGNTTADAALKRKKQERRQSITQMLLVAQQILLDVKSELRDVLTSYKEIEARKAARISAGEELAAITQKELVEKLTPEFLRLKLDSQQRLANAEMEETQALINYNLAILKLEQAKGTLLEFNHISLDRPPADPDENWGKLRFLDTTYDSIFTTK